jgi:hypothetical protein
MSAHNEVVRDQFTKHAISARYCLQRPEGLSSAAENGPSTMLPRACLLLLLWLCASLPAPVHADWLWSVAHEVPKSTTSEGSGYFALVEGLDGTVYLGTAKYGENAYLVAFDPRSRDMAVVVDAQAAIGAPATGFAAQAKVHTRCHVGPSGKVYFATKQGYPKAGELRDAYPGGRPLVYDPAAKTTRVYDVPVPHQGVISITPDESRGVAYISTCSDERPVESAHFMVLDLSSGKYTDLMDTRHMYAFISVDWLGRAYHPVLGGEVARWVPPTDGAPGRLDRLRQTIDGAPPVPETHLADPESHPINWELSPDRKTLYAVPMSTNGLFSYDLTAGGETLRGRRLGKLLPAASATDCRAMCVGPDGTVWAGVAATFEGRGQLLHLVSYAPGDAAARDHGAIAVSNPAFTRFVDAERKPLPWHHGYERGEDGTLRPRYTIMAICAARDGMVYVTTLAPLTLHAIPTGEAAKRSPPRPRVAAVVTAYHENSHADVIASRLLETDTLDGKGRAPRLDLASLYVDQPDASAYGLALARKHQVPVFPSVREALTLGTAKLKVDGVLLIAEHGRYPSSDTGQTVYPKRRLFAEVAQVFEASGRSVPVFHDKHLADNWSDAKWIHDTARRLDVPLMAGSSLPVLWRFPPLDVAEGERIEEVVAVSYHTLDAYGFHALEMVQALVERRRGGETGIRSVQCLTGAEVWKAARERVFDPELFDAALSRLRSPPPQGKQLEDLVREPVLFRIDHADGLRVSVLTLNGAVGEWAVAFRRAEGREVASTLFWTQEARPFYHFAHLVEGIERMMGTARPTWPAERTLLTSGALDALLVSKRDGGRKVDTPELEFAYSSAWRWKEPPPPAAGPR